MQTRVFLNSPMLANGRAAAAYLREVKPLRWSGYVGPDGSVRLMVELESEQQASALPAPGRD